MKDLSSIKVGFFTRYDRLGGSSRLRFFAYADQLKKSGYFDCEVKPFFSDAYLKKFYSTGKKSFFAFIGALFRRLKQLFACRAKNLVIEYELLPVFPFWLEKLFLRNKKYVLDFDDWVWSKYRDNPFCRGKFDKLIAAAAGVIAANDLIFDHCRQLNRNCIKIPTTVDRDALENCEAAEFDLYTIVWIGTPTTYRTHLMALGDTLRRLAEKFDYQLLVISALPLPEIPGVNCRFVKWSEKTQYQYLRGAQVGIMPLPDNDEFAAGKSAYKLIQYLAAGIPAVASNIGENCVVLSDGVTGFLADSPEKWLEALTRLHDDNALREQMSANASRAGTRYFLQEKLAVYADFLEKCFKTE